MKVQTTTDTIGVLFRKDQRETMRAYERSLSGRCERVAPEVALLPEVRDLIGEYPFLAHRHPETVRRALLMLRGVEAPESEVATVLEALTVEGEVLA